MHRAAPIAVLLASALTVCAAPAPSAKSASVSGVVTNQATGAPVRKALVTLQTVDDVYVDQALTDSAGHFAIDNIEAGDYAIWAEAQNYVRTPPDVTRPIARTHFLHLAEAESVRNIAITLAPFAAISGLVADSNGDVVPNAIVRALRYSNGPNGSRLAIKATANANDRGEYRLFNLNPGRWYLGVIKFPTSVDATGIVHNLVAERGYAFTFHAGASRAAEASPIDLNPGDDLALDLRLRALRTFHIRGRVFDPSGHPAPRTGISIDDCSSIGQPSYYAETKSDGSFDIRGMAPGAWCLVADSTVNTSTSRTTERLTISNSDVNDVTMRLEAAIQVSGTTIVEGATAEIPAARVNLTPLSAGDEDSATGIAKDGSFTLTGLAQRIYRVHVERLPHGYYVKALRLGSADISQDALAAIAPGAGPLAIVLAHDAGRLSGTVTAADKGTGKAPLWITLAPAGDVIRPDLVRTVAPESQAGDFLFEDVPPGAYRVFAWELDDVALAASPEFRRLLEASSTAIEIHAGEPANVQTKLIDATAIDEAGRKLR